MAKTLKKMILNWEVYDVGYDSQITIQKNWTDVDSFTLNQSTAKTINIAVPTNSDYVDKTSAQSVWGVKTFTSAPVVPSKTTAAANSWTAVATEAQVYAVAQTVPSVDSSVSSSSTNPVQNKVIKQYVDDAVWAVTGIDFQIVETLPVTWSKWVIYLIANGWTGTNSYDEYIWITSSSSYEKIWSTEVDLSDYVTLATAQTISWTKTFSAEPVLPSKTTAATNSWTKPATEAQVKTVADAIPTVNNATLTITQNWTSAGTFTANASSNKTIALTDTTYESKTAASWGTAVSLVTTWEKYTWNNKQNALTSQTAYTSKGSATKVPQITTNSLWQVTGITEVTITQPTVNNATITFTQWGNSIWTMTTNQSSAWTLAFHDNIPVTQSAYDALPSSKTTDWNTYLIYATS